MCEENSLFRIKGKEDFQFIKITQIYFSIYQDICKLLKCGIEGNDIKNGHSLIK